MQSNLNSESYSNARNVIGVDIGGTFTDLVGYVKDQLVMAKTLTTPANPALGVAKAIELSKVSLAQLNEFLHGSTIAINTVLEKKGANTALLTTVGFRDVYEIGRGNRPEAFDLNFTRPKPLIARKHRFEVHERLNAKGEVLTPLDRAEIVALGERMVSEGIESVAICFLHAYANPAHELLAGQLLREAHPQLFVTLSHEILREFREYERTSTTVLNAYVGPRVKNYLNHLSSDLKGMGYSGHTHIMRSNGGSMSLAHACREPVSMMESGPVAGMIAAGHVAQILGYQEVIGFDMGGTTAKATLIVDGIPAIDEGYYIGGYASGQPMQLPVVSIVEVGSGGGSIAWRDRTGGLHVGPTSASADPGPVCYGRGGLEPTVTDANVILGRLNPARFLGGGMDLDVAAARAALSKNIAQPLGLGVEESALGVIKIADTAMSLAVRAVSVRKGVDPRDAAMIAFGGGGPVHAAALCKEINIPTLIVPKMPGNFSALGMLLAPWRHDFVRTVISVLGKIDPASVTSATEELLASARVKLEEDELAFDAAEFEFAANLRYRGQEHSIPVPLKGLMDLCDDSEQVRQAFNTLHDQRYGHAATGEIIEIVNMRLTVTVPRDDALAQQYLGSAWVSEGENTVQTREVIFDDAEHPVSAKIYWRPSLPAGFTLVGPAVIEEPNSTTVIFPGDQVVVSPQGHLIVSVHLSPYAE